MQFEKVDTGMNNYKSALLICNVKEIHLIATVISPTINSI